MSDVPSKNPLKRAPDRAEQDGQEKRKRYVAQACELCKKRKLRCDGEEPCRRCFERSVRCYYAPGARSRSSGDNDMRSEIAQLTSLVSKMREEIDHLKNPRQQASYLLTDETSDISTKAAQSNRQPQFFHNTPKSLDLPTNQYAKSASSPELPTFTGPVSSDYSFDMAMSILQKPKTTRAAQITGLADDEEEHEVAKSVRERRSLYDIFVSTGRGECERLTQIYDEWFNWLHPVADPDHLRRHVGHFFTHATLQGDFETYPSISQDDILLALALAIALLTEGKQGETLSQEIFLSALDRVQPILLAPKANLGDQVLLILTALHYFLTDQRQLASRTIVVAYRMITESGIHRRELLDRKFPSGPDRQKAMSIIWSIFVCDRQFSFARGVRPCIPDGLIDIPLIEDAPYLRAMVDYMSIGWKSWRKITDSSGRSTGFDAEVMDHLEYQLYKWQSSLPQNLRSNRCFCGRNEAVVDNMETKRIFSMRTLLNLRTNQLLIVLRRPLLFSTEAFERHQDHAARLVEVAEASMALLHDLKHSTDIYKRQLVIFNHFVASALSALSLFLAHSAVTTSNTVPDRSRTLKELSQHESNVSSAKEGISMALALLNGTSEFSSSSQRLLKKYDCLRQALCTSGLLAADKGQVLNELPIGEQGLAMQSEGVSTNEGEPMLFSIDSAEAWDAWWGAEMSSADLQNFPWDLNSMFLPESM